MKTELEIHPAQGEILKSLLFTPEARFAELNTTDLSSDHFNFHLKRLIEIELVKKDGGKYSLTRKGKEFANRFDTDEIIIERQAKVAVLLVGVRGEDDNRQYLCQQRLKQPYFGYWGFPTGK